MSTDKVLQKKRLIFLVIALRIMYIMLTKKIKKADYIETLIFE